MLLLKKITFCLLDLLLLLMTTSTASTTMELVSCTVLVLLHLRSFDGRIFEMFLLKHDRNLHYSEE